MFEMIGKGMPAAEMCIIGERKLANWVWMMCLVYSICIHRKILLTKNFSLDFNVL